MSVSPTAVVYLFICVISLIGIVYSSDIVFNLTEPTISLEMPVPSQGHYGFHSFQVVD
jgi:hypothetical protein